MKNYVEQINALNMPQLHKDIVVGCLLGDASIKGFNSSNKAMLSFGQGLPNKEYLYYLFSILEEYCSQTKPFELDNVDPRYPGKEYKSFLFSTKRSELFFRFTSYL
jgi:hypothetical protein